MENLRGGRGVISECLGTALGGIRVTYMSLQPRKLQIGLSRTQWILCSEILSGVDRHKSSYSEARNVLGPYYFPGKECCITNMATCKTHSLELTMEYLGLYLVEAIYAEMSAKSQCLYVFP